MKESDKITGLFRSRLADREMDVRDGFWEELQKDLSQAESHSGQRKYFGLTPRLFRLSAAASVVLVLAAASAAFWYFSPKEEIQQAFNQVAALSPEGSLNGDIAKESFPSIHKTDPASPGSGTGMTVPGAGRLTASTTSDNDSISVRVSITITQRVYGGQQHNGNGFYGNTVRNNNYHSSNSQHTDTNSDNNRSASSATNEGASALSNNNKSKWALKAAIGSSLSKGDYKMPFTASVSLERNLTQKLSIEAGIGYNRLPGGEHTLQTLSLPVKLNLLMLSTRKVDLYAIAGAALEKCISGAQDNSFSAEPLQASITAGLGVRYKMSDRLALFAEPSVSHHFDTDSSTKSLRTERPTNLNLICGVRMTY